MSPRFTPLPFLLLIVFSLGSASSVKSAEPAAPQLLLDKAVHLRSGETREWNEFPAGELDRQWSCSFTPTDHQAPATLKVRQVDVKERWLVKVNGKLLGELTRNENPMWSCFAVDAGVLQADGNEVVIQPAVERKAAKSDDIRLDQVQLLSVSRAQHLSAARLTVRVTNKHGESVPARITLTDLGGALLPIGADSSPGVAVRTGVVYTLDGSATLPTPAGPAVIYAGRGFEYSLAKQELDLQPGDESMVRLRIRREVDTRGWAACDTHVHTRTHSGHGDSTVDERMVTLAAEGIELPIATDHNVNIDHRPFAEKVGAARYFTPVIGNEVTTRWGHFNVFPFAESADPPDHRGQNWEEIFGAIEHSPHVKAVILNHARDLHGGYRPFGTKDFNPASGEQLQGWKLRANAMEVLNSSATQTDVMQLFHDWMTLLNRGLPLTPVGCSDSHDVARHFVGQGRTYIRCDDRDPGNIDRELATSNFVQGRVRVCYGLLVELNVQERWTSGELAQLSGIAAPNATVRVRGPHWVQADTITLYLNGKAIQTEKIVEGDRKADVLWERKLTLPKLEHDAYVTAIATGPGVDEVFWRANKPYQADGPEWTPRWIGCSGAVRIDSDGDGRFFTARDYAVRLLADHRTEVSDGLLEALKDFDEATVIQTLSLLNAAGEKVLSDIVSRRFMEAGGVTQRGYRQYMDAWRAHWEATDK